MAGFVYILSNPSMPRLLKIGKSDRDPSEFRASELYTTGVPEPFKVEYFALVRDHHVAERVVHSRLDGSRPNAGREFFRVGVEEAIILIRQCAEIQFEKVFFKTESEITREKLKREQEKIERQNRMRQEEIARQEEAARKRLAESKAAEERERWSEACSAAQMLVDESRRNFASRNATSNVWKYYWLTMLVFCLPALFLEASIGAVLVIANLVSFAPLFWIADHNKRKEQAETVYNRDVLEKVAQTYYKGGDCNVVLQDALQRRESVKQA